MGQRPKPDEKLQDSPLEVKLEAARQIIEDEVKTKGSEKVFVKFGSNIKSIITLWLVKTVCESQDLTKPRVLVLENEEDYFESGNDFTNRTLEEWGFRSVKPDTVKEANQDFFASNKVELIIHGNNRLESKIDDFNKLDESRNDDLNVLSMFSRSEIWIATWRFMVPDLTSEEPKYKLPKSEDELQTSKHNLPVPNRYWDGSGAKTRGSGDEETTPEWIRCLTENF